MPEVRKLDPSAPVLLLGRGGSGTRLLSQLAGDLGVFLGSAVSCRGDSEEWVGLIYEMTALSGSKQELPLRAEYGLRLRQKATEVLEGGPAHGLWGLKLPELMLVLPSFIEAFPRAKVIHLLRHPTSVSLRRTHMTSRRGNVVGDAVLPAALEYCGVVADASVSTEHLNNACSWRFQVERIVDFASCLGNSRYLELRYEDLCSDPRQAFEVLGRFLGVDVTDLRESVEVDKSRQGSWDPRDPAAEEVWSLCGDLARRLGYGPESSQPDDVS